jgi:cyclopropane fatty-acyl-phospholipid synthase-like methyltransferase
MVQIALADSTTAPRVVNCYAVLDRLMTACGFDDFTDGMYEGNPDRPYGKAQARQAEVLLDRVGCHEGTRLLDIGCGFGRILKAAQVRGAEPTGITVSPPQVRHATRQRLDVRLIDYKQMDDTWNGQFDAVIANGSLEHFAQAEDAVKGQDDAIYEHLFQTVHRLLDPAQGSGRFVTTAIHSRDRTDPRDWLRPDSSFAVGSLQFHFSRLFHAFGGWYPIPGQLERCAAGTFRLIHEEDGTEDYRLTSEACLKGVRQALWSPRLFLFLVRTIPLLVTAPAATVELMRCMLVSESWNWQFRGDPSPTILLRQTWERIG